MFGASCRPCPRSYGLSSSSVGEFLCRCGWSLGQLESRQDERRLLLGCRLQYWEGERHWEAGFSWGGCGCWLTLNADCGVSGVPGQKIYSDCFGKGKEKELRL